MKLSSGTRISFSYKGRPMSGAVITVTHERIVIKLASGYNLTAKPDELKEIEEKKEQNEERKEEGKTKPQRRATRTAQKPREGLPRIALLHTGGTIASRVDYATGAVIAQYTAEEILSLYPELLHLAKIESRLIANMQSEMMRFAHWNLIARGVEKAVREGVDGVIVTHGTDILAISSAALSFALENLSVPVILVGSQRSSDRPSSDAVSNLLCAARFIAEEGKRFSGVGICMHEGIAKDDCVILPACRTRKMHTSRRDAFKAVNDEPYARITYPSLQVERLKEYPRPAQGTLVVKPFDEKLKVGILRAHPQMWAEELLAYEEWDGLVLELLGIGHAPTMVTDTHNSEHARIMAAIARLAGKMPVVAAPQTLYGRINMEVYSPGRQLIDAGVLGQGLDLTPETAFVKLAWLLSNCPKETKKLYGKNLRGEYSERSEEDGFSTL